MLEMARYFGEDGVVGIFVMWLAISVKGRACLQDKYEAMPGVLLWVRI